MDVESSIFQERYLRHRERKARVLQALIEARHSSRVFANRSIPSTLVSNLMELSLLAPSSCDRRAISLTATSSRDDLDLLGGLLVGGVGWIHRSPTVLLIWANPSAYGDRPEREYMPYLDAGVVVQNLYLISESLGLKGCFVNPQVRERNVGHFRDVFGLEIFCGAFAVGFAHDKELGTKEP